MHVFKSVKNVIITYSDIRINIVFLRVLVIIISKKVILSNGGYEAHQNRINRGYEAHQNRINRGYEAHQNRINKRNRLCLFLLSFGDLQ